jgi:murein DD-endopeptidase MepM/ murein hydrolase activator NlpD
MAAGIGASAGAKGRGYATVRGPEPGATGFRMLCCLLLVLCAGCTSSRRDAPLLADSLLLMPVDRGRLSSAYGMRYHPILKRPEMHRGIDWAAPRGTPVRAAGHGTVVAAGRWGGYGHYLRIDHGGRVATAYAHLDRFAPGLRPGRLVRQGELIGDVGSTGRATGPHLHYEILIAGRQVDPLALVPASVAPDGPSAAVIPASFAPGAAHLTAGDLAPPVRPGGGAPALDRSDLPELIDTQDLLRRFDR